MKSIFLIINHKTLVISILAVISTYLCIENGITADYPLTIIATAIIFPIVFSINGAYKRRELALIKYGILKAHGKAIYFVTRDWLENPRNYEEMAWPVERYPGAINTLVKCLWHLRMQNIFINTKLLEH